MELKTRRNADRFLTRAHDKKSANNRQKTQSKTIQRKKRKRVEQNKPKDNDEAAGIVTPNGNTACKSKKQ